LDKSVDNFFKGNVASSMLTCWPSEFRIIC